jgi:hypothetical protein
MTQKEPIRILGIIPEEVTSPRNDGTPGSALYAVPLQLSGYVSDLWADLFVATWNHPPSFTSRHRPGMARVEGDRIILNGTTLEEIEQVHKETLKHVLQEVNSRVDQLERQAEREDQIREQRRRQHADHVREMTVRIQFDD